MAIDPDEQAQRAEDDGFRVWSRVLLEDHEAVTIAGLAERRGEDVETTRRWVGAARSRRDLCAVSVDGELLIPVVQLTDDGQLDETISWYTRQLIDGGYDNWTTWRWLVLPTDRLDGAVLWEEAFSDPRAAKIGVRVIVEQLMWKKMGYDDGY